MSKTNSTYINTNRTNSKFSDYYALVKFKLSMMVLISSILAYIIVAGTSFSITTLSLLMIGGFFITAASNTMNQVLERDFDKLMTRTQNRPLATGRMKVSEAVLFAGISLLVGIFALGMLNPITALFGMIAFVSYAFIYTPLKRYSTISVAVGAIPGAMPVLIGTTAHSAELTLMGLVLFGIQFLWQFPHFWAIGYLSFDDYKKAGYKLLPITATGEIDRNVGLHSFIYALLVFPLLAFSSYLGLEMNWLVLLIVGLATAVYAFLSFEFYKKNDRSSAMRLMFSSFIYLPLVLFTFLFN